MILKSQYLTNFYFELSSKKAFKSEMNFKNIEVITNKGYITHFYERKNFYTLENLKNIGVEVDPEIFKDLAGTLKLVPSFTQEIYTRAYLELGDVAASVVGIFRFLLLIGNIITIIPYEFHFYQCIINKILKYNYQDAETTIKNENYIINNILIDDKNKKSKFCNNYDLSTLRNINNESYRNNIIECSKISINSNYNKSNNLLNTEKNMNNSDVRKNLENEINEDGIRNFNNINFYYNEKNDKNINKKDIRFLTEYQGNSISTQNLNAGKLQDIKENDIKKKIEETKIIFKNNNKNKLRFTAKEMLFINLNCFFKKSNRSIEDKMKKISQSHDFLDFFKLINVYRDIFLLKKILLTKDQLN